MSDKKLSWRIKERDGCRYLVDRNGDWILPTQNELEAWELLRPEPETPEKRKPILCLDFDGVVHWYREGWRGETNIYDEPTPGFFDWLTEVSEHFRVVVRSSRCATDVGRTAIEIWLCEKWSVWAKNQGIFYDRPTVEIWAEKPPAFVTIDDRALTFTGRWEDFSVERLKAFKTWQQEGEKD